MYVPVASFGAVGEPPRTWFSVWDRATGSWQLIAWYLAYPGYPEMLAAELVQCAAFLQLPGARTPYLIAHHPSMVPVGGLMSWGLGAYEGFEFYSTWIGAPLSWSFAGWLYGRSAAMRKLAGHLADCGAAMGGHSKYLLADYPWGRPIDDRMRWR